MKHNHPEGYFALPKINYGPVILVLHAWWGLNETIKFFCRRLAELGFLALTLDIYHGEKAETIQDVEVLGQALDSKAAHPGNLVENDPYETRANVEGFENALGKPIDR